MLGARAGVGGEGPHHAGRAAADLRIGLVDRVDIAVQGVAAVVRAQVHPQLARRQVDDLALQVRLDHVLRLVERVVVLVLQVIAAILGDARRVDEGRDAAAAGAVGVAEPRAVVGGEQQLLPTRPVDVALLADAVDVALAMRAVDVPGPARRAEPALQAHQRLVDVRGVVGGGDAQEADRGRVVPRRDGIRPGEQHAHERRGHRMGRVEGNVDRPEVRRRQGDVDVVHVIVAVDQLAVGLDVVVDLVFEPRKSRVSLHRRGGVLVVIGVVLDPVVEGVVRIGRVEAGRVAGARRDVENAGPVGVDSEVHRAGGRETRPVRHRRAGNGVQLGLVIAEIQEA